VVPIFAALLSGCIILAIEYKSGLFQAPSSKSYSEVTPLWLFLSTFTVIEVVLSFRRIWHIRLSSDKYFREEFSLAALSLFFWLSVALTLSVQGSLMVWYPIVAAFHTLSGKKIAIPAFAWEGVGLLSLILVLSYMIANSWHQNWNGLTSTKQHENDQRSESFGILAEGMRELIRFLVSKTSLERFTETDIIQSLGHLEQSEDYISQAWKDQSRELLRLTTSSYDFNSDFGWHDKQGCWVGLNIDTQKLVLLFPVHASLMNKDIERLLLYSESIANAHNQEIDELIVAFREKGDKSMTPVDLYPQIRFETEQDLIARLVNFTDYFNDIRKRVEVQTLAESSLTLRDVYVPSQLLESDEKSADNDLENYLRVWSAEPSQRQIALLGEYGQGKSSAALMFTYHLINERLQTLHRIPILIELRGKSPRDLRPLELFGAWASQYRIDPQALMRLHISGRLILIFEGFDEMALIGNDELRLRHFTSLWKFCYPNAKILITGRPNFFLDDTEMKRALGIISPISDRPYCEAIRLEPFSIDQIQQALRAHKPLVRDQICTLAKHSDRFFEIVARPSLLHVVAQMWEIERLHDKAELLSSAYVMGCFVRSSYRRQGLKLKGSRDFMALNSSERDYFMCGIAAYMVTKEFSNQIPKEHLNRLIINLTDSMPNSVSASSSVILDEDRRPLKSRLQEPNDIEHVITDVRTCGLLVDDLSAPGTFKFGHKSFMEYLFALTVKDFILDSRSEKARAIRKVTCFPVVSILYLPVSFGFLSELIGTDAATKKTPNYKDPRNERATSLRLLKVISNSSNFFDFSLFRFHLFRFSYEKSAKGCNITMRKFIEATSPRIMSAYFVLILSIYILVIGRYMHRYNVLVVTMFSTCFLYFNLFLMSKTRLTVLLKLRLWNSICKELLIDDKALHKVAGTFVLPWTGNQPFDYFLVQKANYKMQKDI
jgi:hypothetical protein